MGLRTNLEGRILATNAIKMKVGFGNRILATCLYIFFLLFLSTCRITSLSQFDCNISTMYDCNLFLCNRGIIFIYSAIDTVIIRLS